MADTRIISVQPAYYAGAGADQISVADLLASFTKSGQPNAIARKLLTAAQRPLGDISAVMASPPTITDPLTDGANSTVQTGQNAATGGVYQPTDATRVTVYGGPLSGGRIQTITRVSGARIQGHSSGIAFYTDAQTVDFALRCNGARWIAYVTQPDGTRARIQASDRPQAYSNLNYYKLDFGSTAASGRLVEIYIGLSGNFGGINVPTGYSIWPADLSQQPKIAWVGDSFAEGSMNDGTLNLRLSVVDWFAAMLGANIPTVNGVGSTGLFATNAANNYLTFGARIAAGDMDASRIGSQDLAVLQGSVNDDSLTLYPTGTVAVVTDAQLQAGMQSATAGLMVAQPNAIIVGLPRQFSSSAAAPAARVAAQKAGFLAAAAGSPRCLWLDNTLYESAPGTGVIGADNVHPGGVYGARQIGERLARSTLTALQAIA